MEPLQLTLFIQPWVYTRVDWLEVLDRELAVLRQTVIKERKKYLG